jgi:serine/threonine protein kinase/ankyrin repeat protein
VVEEVYSCLSHKRYARKTVVRSRTNGPAQKDLVKELEALKSLSHRHLVKVLGSYTDTHHIAYLMLPVAQGNLDDLLRKPGGLTDSDKHDTRSFFGCLAGAVNYLHRSRIRHRDLSLKNILVHDGSVFVSDFGSAYKWAGSNNQGSATQHHNVPATRFYMAPEIARNAARNSSSDMWSLGVIFLEMTTLLVGRTLAQLRSKLSDNLRQNIEPYLWANPRVVTDWLQILQAANQGPAHDMEPLEWIRDLLHIKPKNRPTSGALMEYIHDTQSFHIFCCIDCQSEFRDRRFKDNDQQILEEGISGDAAHIMQNVACILEETPQPVIVSSQTHSTIRSWLEDTEVPIVEPYNIVVPDIVIPDQVLPSRMPGEFDADDDYEETNPTDSEIGSSVDHMSQFPAAGSGNVPSLSTSVTPNEHRSPSHSHLGCSQSSSLPVVLEHVKDTGLGFFEIDSPSSSDDGIREISDSSGSEAGSDGTIKQPHRIDHAFGICSEDRRGSVLERPHFAGDVDRPLQVLDSLDPILEVSDDSDDDDAGSATEDEKIKTSSPQPALNPLVASADDMIEEKEGSVHRETGISTLIKPSEVTGAVEKTLHGARDGSMQANSNTTEVDVLGAALASVDAVHTKKGEHEAQSVEVSATDRKAMEPFEYPMPTAALGAEPGSEQPDDEPIIRHERNSGKKRSAPAASSRRDSAGADSEDQEEAERPQATLRKRRPDPTGSAGEDDTNHTILAPQQEESRDSAEELADQPTPIVSSKLQHEDLFVQPAVEDIHRSSQNTTKPNQKEKGRATSTEDQMSLPPPDTVTEPSKTTDDDSRWPTVELGPQTPPVEPKSRKTRQPPSQADETVTDRPANHGAPLEELKPRKKKKKKPSLHVTFAEEHPASSTPPIKEEPPIMLELNPSDYIRDTWETASSVATSTMSDRTKSILQGFSLPRWWDHDHNLLEVFCSQGKAQAVRALLDKGCNPGKAGPKGKRRSGPITVAIQGASLRHNRCVKALIEAEADVNVVNHSSGKTPLHLAIENPRFRGYEHLICALIDGGANPNHADIRGDRPITKILLESGNGLLEDHRKKALALLLRDKATDIEVTQPGTLNTPLHLAVRRKDPFAVAMLIFKKANVNAKNAAGSTPLLVAANQLHNPTTKDQKDLISILLQTDGVFVNEKAGVKEQTALHYAVNAGVYWAVDMLLEYGADPTCKDSEDRDALALAQSWTEENTLKSDDRESIVSRLRQALVKEELSEKDADAATPKRPKKKYARKNKPAASSAES